MRMLGNIINAHRKQLSKGKESDNEKDVKENAQEASSRERAAVQNAIQQSGKQSRNYQPERAGRKYR